MPVAVKDIIAENIRYAREQAGLSQTDVSRALGLASHSGVSEIESGHRRVSATELVRLSDVLSKPIDWFFNADSGREDFVALARAQDRTVEFREALAEAEKYFQNYLLLQKVLKKSRRR